MEWSQITVAALGGAAIVGSAIISIVYSKNLKLREEQNKDKKKAYMALIKTLDSARAGNPVESNAMNRHAQEVVFFGSTGVLKAFGDYQQFVFSSIVDGQVRMTERDDAVLWMKLLGELMFQIRKDLGNLRWRDKVALRKNSEKWHDPLRLTITDVENFVPENYKGRRGRKYNAPPILNGDEEVW